MQHLYLMVFDETCTVEVADEGDLTRSVYSFDFTSSYQRAKPLDAFPGLKEKKIAQLEVMFGIKR